MPEPSSDPVAQVAEPIPPLIIAVASGKGGVGKTMLTVACAYELSLGGPTLVIDLDFFNRGLSGLFRGRKEIGLIARPRFLDSAGGPPAAPWTVVEVEHQLYHIAYPDLVPDELVRLENRPPADLAQELRDFIQRAGQLCGARSIVLDCHGGPDHTSFAAALLAHHTLLISEPDRITLHGTLNFLRQLQRGLGLPNAEGRLRIEEAAAAGQHTSVADPQPAISHQPSAIPPADVHLVFNKIVPGFRTPFLRRFYDQSLRATFRGRDLLGIFPLELPLSKAFEETPLITRSYPYSLLARKMRVLLLDLLGERANHYLAPSAPTLPQWVRKYRRRTLGRTPWFIDQNVILQIITFVVLLFVVLSFLDKRFVASQRGVLEKAVILLTLAEHPELTLSADSMFLKMLHETEVGSFAEKRRDDLPYSFGMSDNLALLAGWFRQPHDSKGTVRDLEEKGLLKRATEKARRDGDANMLMHLDFDGLGSVAKLRAYLQIPASEAAAWDRDHDFFGALERVIDQHLNYSASEVESTATAEFIIPFFSTDDWRHNYAGLANGFDLLSPPPEFQGEWKAVSEAVRAPTRFDWALRALVEWWQGLYWHATMVALAWLGTAFYLDCIRKIDTAFVRALRVSYYRGMLWFGLALLMWGLPVVYIFNGLSSQPGQLFANERAIPSLLLLLPYLFVTGHQIYRCYRLFHDGALDLASSRVAQQMHGGDFRTRLVATQAFLRKVTPLTDEVILRGVFVLALCGGLVGFFVVGFLGKHL